MATNKICIVSPCFNEVDNIEELYRRVCNAISNIENCVFEFIIIDNCSTDGTFEKLRALADTDKNLKIIRNMRNFGHIRSPYYGLLQSHADATIYLASDLQDPPELIPDFIKAWKNGALIALATKPSSSESAVLALMRRTYYRILNGISGVNLISDATGFGIYDRMVLDEIRNIADPYPYFRGLICELGYPIETIEFNQPRRMRGLSKNNFYTLYDIAMLGLVSHSKVPLRLATFAGFTIGFLSFFSAIAMFALKLIFWDKFAAGIAPIMIIMFLLFGAVMVFIGILGEYISSIHTYVQKRPVVVEKERINF